MGYKITKIFKKCHKIYFYIRCINNNNNSIYCLFIIIVPTPDIDPGPMLMGGGPTKNGSPAWSDDSSMYIQDRTPYGVIKE